MNEHDEPPINLGDAVKFARERSDASARQISMEAGLSPSYVSRVERGELKPSLEAFAKIMSVLDVSDKELIFMIRRLA